MLVNRLGDVVDTALCVGLTLRPLDQVTALTRDSRGQDGFGMSNSAWSIFTPNGIRTRAAILNGRGKELDSCHESAD